MQRVDATNLAWSWAEKVISAQQGIPQF